MFSNYILRPLAYTISKFNLNNTVIVFDTTFGYAGHSKACFDYMTRTFPHKTVRFISKKPVPKLKNFHNYFSVTGIIYTYSAKFQIYTVSAPIFQNFNKKKTIQFWHGTPIKALGKQDKSMKPAVLNRMIYEFNSYSLIVVADEQTKKALVRGFLIQKNVIVAPTPYVLKLHSNRSKYAAIRKVTNKSEYSFQILYAPTFRPYSDRSWDLNRCTKWRNFCMANNIIFQTLYHPSDLFYNKDTSDDILTSLTQCDLLITDFSSVCFDARKINLPTFLFQPDSYKYQNARGISDAFTENNFKTFQNVNQLCTAVSLMLSSWEGSKHPDNPFRDSNDQLLQSLMSIGLQ